MTVIRRQARVKPAGYVANERVALRRASVVVRLVVDLHARRLRHLPDAEELERLGDLIARGDSTPADVALVRSLPAQYVCANASAAHLRVLVAARSA